MNSKFGFDQYEDHDFYHVRMGRGAAVVAVKKLPESNGHAKENMPDLHVARTFCSREQILYRNPQQLDPVQSIKEKDGIVEIEIKFERVSPSDPSYHPMKAVVKRKVPSNQVVFEIVERNDSPQ